MWAEATPVVKATASVSKTLLELIVAQCGKVSNSSSNQFHSKGTTAGGAGSGYGMGITHFMAPTKVRMD